MFAHELAAELGIPVGELMDRIDSQEFTRWMAFDRLSPIGGKRMDALAASVCATVANAAPFRKGRPLKVSDFLIRWFTPPLSKAAMKDKVRRIAAVWGRRGKDNDRHPERQAERPDGGV